MRYRQYPFSPEAVLLDVGDIPKLPKNARKHRDVDVWISTDKDGGYSKICRSNSDITFGTRVKTFLEIDIGGKDNGHI